ncbi:MAG: PAS domain S-box protein [Blastocatellia bacterium]|nr:PAS domain S-box protein [Blastocatellia bacterium]
MRSKLQIIYFEDNPLYIEQVRNSLQAGKVECDLVSVGNKSDLIKAIKDKQYDIIFSDYLLISNKTESLLKTIQAVSPNTPFICFFEKKSEEIGILMIRTGVTNYLSKDNLSALPSLVKSTIEETRNHTEELQPWAESVVLDSVKKPVVVIDKGGKVLFFNQSAVNSFGYSRKDINDISILLPKYIDGVENFSLSTINFGNCSSVEAIAIDYQQKNLPVEVYISKAEWANSSIITLTIDDLTKKKRLENDSFRSQRLESIGVLAGGIAHDLNNLLTPNLIAIQILKNRIEDKKLRLLLNTMESSTKRGAELIKQILSFAKGFSDKTSVVQIKHLIYEIEKLLKETFPRSITIRVGVAKNINPVYGDPTQLHQIIMNLAVNARDAMPTGGILSITAGNTIISNLNSQEDILPGSYVEITVSDTGKGISKQLLGKIFEPFFTTKQEYKGTGLGLSTALSIVKSHNGFLTVNSEEGKGTTFKVLLPITSEEKGEAVDMKQSVPTGKGQTILIVDDEAAIREITKISLEAYNYTVLVARDGIETCVYTLSTVYMCFTCHLSHRAIIRTS